MSKPLDTVDLTATMTAEESERRVAKEQERLTRLTLIAAGLLEKTTPGPGIVVVFEGFDASGKGGAIRRVSGALDPRHVRVVPIGPPTPNERAHHFLWRFQHPLPPHGELTIFDRSWYGRILVERVESLVTPSDVRRSAKEIVEFERALVEDNTIVVKFWLQISSEEQLRRFEQRRDDPLKQWKLTPDDWHNREQRAGYTDAVNDMIEWTDHEHARWNVIAAENKHYARAKILSTLNERVEGALESGAATS